MQRCNIPQIHSLIRQKKINIKTDTEDTDEKDKKVQEYKDRILESDKDRDTTIKAGIIFERMLDPGDGVSI